MSRPFRVTFVYPCVGRRAGSRRYLRSWQMEPLPVAALAGLTPPGVETRFFDDRLEEIAYDAPTDLAAIPVEVYTARRAYQIASEYRRRGVPVVMGGFHATLAPEEVGRFAEAVVIGEAEELWAGVIEDFRCGRPRPRYQAPHRPPLALARPDRRVFGRRRYLPVALVEAGRGCPLRCEFCAVTAYFGGTRRVRPVGDVVEELARLDRRRLVFFVDDNLVADRAFARELLGAIAPLRIRWVSQGSLDMAADEELLALLRRSGCVGMLIGFESMEATSLRRMGKGVNLAAGDYGRAVAALQRHGLRVYGTFVFGYDNDTPESFDAALDFALAHGLYLCGFNHLLPLPGTPLYARLQREGRLRYERWWLAEGYRYNTLPFEPARMGAEEVRERCLRARRRFYSPGNIVRRGLHPANRAEWLWFLRFFGMNLLHLGEVGARDGLPLGDEGHRGGLLEVGR